MNTDGLTREVSGRAGWSIVMGLLTVAVGVAMILYPMATATASTLFFGSALIIVAVAQIVFAFNSPTAGRFFLKLLLGIVYGIAGVALVALPGIGVVMLTAVVGAMLIAEAILETVIAVSLSWADGRGGFLLSALISLLLGVMILVQWPISSIWAIGTLVGVAVLINGITRVVISGMIRHEARAVGTTPA
jgi:uncharacterized membrane protein HdeD (DUF308 family)